MSKPSPKVIARDNGLNAKLAKSGKAYIGVGKYAEPVLVYPDGTQEGNASFNKPGKWAKDVTRALHARDKANATNEATAGKFKPILSRGDVVEYKAWRARANVRAFIEGGQVWVFGDGLRDDGHSFRADEFTPDSAARYVWQTHVRNADVVERINTLLEADVYGSRPDSAEAFREKFGDTSVAEHTKLAAGFKAEAMKHKKAYEAKNKIKAHGESGYANLSYYFENSPEGKEYDRLMSMYRKHDKVAKLLKKSGRNTIGEW